MALIRPPKPDTEEHKNLVQLVLDSVESSFIVRSDKEREWRTAEENMWLVSKTAKEVSAEVGRGKKPKIMDEIGDRIHIPVFYALNWAQMSVLYQSIIKRDPLFPLLAMSPDDRDPALLLESMLASQAHQRRWNLKLFQALYSGFTYGVAFKKHYWLKKETTSLDAIEQPVVEGIDPETGQPRMAVDAETGEPKTEVVITESPITEYEGTEWEYVSPWDFFFDPSVPARDLQDGEFVCHRSTLSENSLLEAKEQGEYDYVDEALEGVRWHDFYQREGENKIFRTRLQDPGSLWVTNEQKTHYIWEWIGRIVPKRFKLSPSTRPQKWAITMCNGVIIRAEPWTYRHNRYPFSCWEPHPVIQIPYAPSYVDLQAGLGKWINWSMNSRRDAVMRSLNSWLFVDVDSIEDLAAFKSNNPMKIIPSRRGHGQSMQDAVYEARFTDASMNNVTDANLAMDMLQRMFALSENQQGQFTQGRKTATETSAVLQGSLVRGNLLTDLYMTMMHAEETRQAVANNQQFLPEPSYVRIFGDRYLGMIRRLQEAGIAPDRGPFLIHVSKQDIGGQFDYQAAIKDQSNNEMRANILAQYILPMVLRGAPLMAQTEGVAIKLSEFFRVTTQFLDIHNFEQDFLMPIPPPQPPAAPAGIPPEPGMGGAA
jgi:hypothetical protein